jgi:DNA (cytosine-5)-methyltransferase 3A
MNVLSLFDGISCGMVALERAGVKVSNYYASEIKKSAIKCSSFNYPDIIHIGDVTKVSYSNGVLYTENGEYKTGEIDLIIGGSPCQDFSPVKWINWQANGLSGDKSKLFYEYLRILREVKPKYFLLENVKMKKQAEKELTDFLGVDGLHINSNLVSYQNRPRIYWTNIPGASVPKDKNINFQDFKETDEVLLEYTAVNRTPSREKMWNNGNGKNTVGQCANITNSNKIYCITRKQDRAPNSGLIEYKDFCRYLSRKEIELGQTLPIGYTDMLTYSQMQDVCGDGWTVDVIAHLFKGLKEGASNG